MEKQEEAQEMGQSIAKLVNREIIPWLKIRAHNELIPDSIISQLKSMGLFGVNIPDEYGGSGLGSQSIARIVRELSRGSIAFASLIFSHCKVNSYLCNGGTDEQKCQWLPKLASGEVIAAHALTESTGKAVANFTTTIWEDGDRLVLDGCKSFVTNAATAGLYAVVAKREGQEGSLCSIALIKNDTVGLTIGKEIERIGLQEVSLAPIVLSDCYVAKKDILGGWDKDAASLLACVRPAARLNYVARAAGIAVRAFEEANTFVHNKYSGQRLLIDIPMVRLRLAEMRAKVSCIDMILRDLSRQLEEGKVEMIDASAAKVYCTKTAGEVVRSAVELHGGSGYASNLPIGKLYRDVEALSIVGTPNDIILSDISDILLGLEASGSEITVGIALCKGGHYEY
ncbi:MAG: Acyl-CoA dehydrogenase-like protein [Candidatus Nomurabacteria bacterium GW2011_GWA2_40_9]|uniref:Acyl-CoA dehydrogenase-like protein n=1 Tax=Candidatus Nomurabacteria bacterium GW2011_GWA2_40_9 TaxID=1618734 RepID=A0A0G0WTF3_9BACT|nr:MAG: Acyl-CoA dehydrogenase-like protein [Candidatus Nomurabacteria bacterium GW2011_GWA2_40_9]